MYADVLDGGSGMVSDDSGQAYTLEGVLGAILVVTAVVYGLGAIDTRAWQTQTDQNTQQLQNRANDLLTVAGESGALREAVLCYRDSRQIAGDDDPAQQSEFEDMLNQTFDSQGDQYNLYFAWNGTDERETTIASSLTDESADRAPLSAATASTTVTLTDDMPRRIGDDCSADGPEISDISTFYVPDIDDDSTVYNVVEVRLVVW